MVVPKRSESGGMTVAKKRSGGRSLWRDIAMAVFVGWVFGIMILMWRHLIKDQNAIDTNLKDIKIDAPIQSIDAKNLIHEDSFHKTIKNCVPDVDDRGGGGGKKQNCGEFIPQEAPDIQRVAIITPPGQLGKLLYKHIVRIVKQHSLANTLELIHTSHVPPYGYGKSHGLTKIIRLISQPMVIGVVDALQGSLQSEEMHKDITLQDLKATLRQLIRFHCRLNHISAHTAIMTIDMQQLIDNYEMTSAQIFDFLTLHNDKNKDKQQQHIEFELQQQRAMMDNDDEQLQIVSAKLAFVSKMLTRIQAMWSQQQQQKDGGAGEEDKKDKTDIFDVLDQVLLDELKQTKQLTSWPCLSFFTVGESANPLQLSKFNHRIAQNFAPNCTAPYTSCWVERDKCEAKGDGECKKQKK